MKFLLALWLGKFINLLINIVDKSRGSNLSGEKALLVDPDMLKKFKGIDPEKTLFITGSNGKSTTNNLVNHILKSRGIKVVSNIEGANLKSGIATALLKNSSTLTGKIKGEYCVFETDERYLALIHEQIPAKNLLITNVQRDQSQRNGDPDFVYSKILPVVKKDVRIFLNNDEPRTMSFAMHNKNVVTYGVRKHGESYGVNEKFPTMACPYCHHDIEFLYYNNPGIGKFRCTNCGSMSDGDADYEVTDADFTARTFKIGGAEFPMPYNIPYMLYNYAAATAAVKEIVGIEPAEAAEAFRTFKNIGGRFEVLKYGDKTIKYMRFKQENPETVQTCINIMAADKEEKVVCLGPAMIIDTIPHYANTAYLGECDFTGLEASGVKKYYCFTDVTCWDMANTLLYQGIDREKIEVEETADPAHLTAFIDRQGCGNVYLITWIHTFDDLQKILHLEAKEGM